MPARHQAARRQAQTLTAWLLTVNRLASLDWTSLHTTEHRQADIGVSIARTGGRRARDGMCRARCCSYPSWILTPAPPPNVQALAWSAPGLVTGHLAMDGEQLGFAGRVRGELRVRGSLKLPLRPRGSVAALHTPSLQIAMSSLLGLRPLWAPSFPRALALRSAGAPRRRRA